ncbi:MAG TPA: nucleotide exchange factor GrpE [Gemmatimonadota bacterium]|nr:nucleotide exchange factor GrpE [Gemmatimonadota bacterium]
MLNPWKDRKQEAGPETEDEDIDETAADPAEEDRAPAEPAGGGSDAATGDETGDLEAELAELKDRHLRLAAEFENFRKRTRREASTGRGMAQAELLRQILPTLDDLARVADTPHESTTVQALDEGIELILRNFRKQLGDAGLERIEALDQRFDPERHQAVMTTGTDDPELDETISRVLVEGYEFQGRLVRPAQVEVRRYEEPAAEEDEG